MLYRVCIEHIWTDDIHEEWIRNLLINRPDLSRKQLEKVRSLMDSHVPGALVTRYEGLISSITLPDQDDRHVVAAAIQAEAEVIVTFNLKDFPDDVLAHYGLKALHPDDFISDLIDLNREVAVESVCCHRGSLKNPPFTVSEYLDCLLRQKLPEAVSKFRLLQCSYNM